MLAASAGASRTALCTARKYNCLISAGFVRDTTQHEHQAAVGVRTCEQVLVVCGGALAALVSSTLGRAMGIQAAVPSHLPRAQLRSGRRAIVGFGRRRVWGCCRRHCDRVRLARVAHPLRRRDLRRLATQHMHLRRGHRVRRHIKADVHVVVIVVSPRVLLALLDGCRRGAQVGQAEHHTRGQLHPAAVE